MQPHYWTIGRGATGWAVNSARLGVSLGLGRWVDTDSGSVACFQSHTARTIYAGGTKQLPGGGAPSSSPTPSSGRRRTAPTCCRSAEFRPLVVLFLLRPTTSAVTTSRPPATEVHRSRPAFGRLARLVRPLAARRSCCSAAAVYGVAGVTSREGMAGGTVRYATCHKYSGRACCSHHAPCMIRHSARARDMPDARIQATRGSADAGGRPAHCPVPMRAVLAWLVQPTHRAAHSRRCGASAPAYRAPSNMQRATGNTVHRATRARRGTCRRCVCVCAHTATATAHWDSLEAVR